MSDTTPLRSNMQIEGARFRSGVSEALLQGIEQNINFTNYFQTIEKDFKVNGNVGLLILPFTVDGMDVIEFTSQIIDVWMYVMVPGASGSTEFDCQVSPSPGSSFVSIFTTKPRISYNAGVSEVWVGVVNPALIGPDYSPPTYTPPPNTVRPVLDASVVNSIAAWSALKVIVTAKQAGSKNCGLLIRYRRTNS